jgi:peptidoglycan-associated lipoprotein
MEGRQAAGLFVALLMTVAVAGCAAQSGRSETSTITAATDERGTTTMPMYQSDARGVMSQASVRPRIHEFVAAHEIRDIHFEFDRYEIRPMDADVLESGVQWLKGHPDYLVLIEGHADERGTSEYNVALGERRARASMNYLVSHGIQATRITVLSYGEERPLCREHTEECWSQNRRSHFLVKAR